ncbi:hypothetical protein BT96DRAFT_251156 [Gymnopus androsaceus JB14]|uniref:Uncharacterized protein n=1 Tax=Gymnopus androsaceus JB14 TaxID=1447944 RepID=A0A6A4I704_9AGAR|nr:hypothetical protein BT96DRAFT_251156 [Gymnopus androsaceus JB14]
MATTKIERLQVYGRLNRSELATSMKLANAFGLWTELSFALRARMEAALIDIPSPRTCMAQVWFAFASQVDATTRTIKQELVFPIATGCFLILVQVVFTAMQPHLLDGINLGLGARYSIFRPYHSHKIRRCGTRCPDAFEDSESCCNSTRHVVPICGFINRSGMEA